MEPCGGVLRSSARPPQGSCGGLAEVLRRSCGGPCGGLAELSTGLAEVSCGAPQGSCGGLAEVLRRSCGGPCGGLAEFIEILRRPPQDFKLLHYVVIGRAVADGGAQVPGHHQKKVEQLWAPPKNSQIRTKNYKCPNIYPRFSAS